MLFNAYSSAQHYTTFTALFLPLINANYFICFLCLNMIYRFLEQMARPWKYFRFQLDRRIKQYGFYLWCNLEAANFAWKVKVTEHASGKSLVRTSWSFIKDSMFEIMDKMELLLDRVEALLRQLKIRYQNLLHTFLNATKIQYGKVSYLVFMSILPIFSKQPSSFPFFFFLAFIVVH